MTSPCIAGCGRESQAPSLYCTTCAVRIRRFRWDFSLRFVQEPPTLREAPLVAPTASGLYGSGRRLQLRTREQQQRNDILDAIQKLSECPDYSLYRLSCGLGGVWSASVVSALRERVLPDHARLISQLARGTPRLGETPRLMKKSIERGSPFPLDAPQHLALMIYAERQITDLGLTTSDDDYPYWCPLAAAEQEVDPTCCGVLTERRDLSYVWVRHATTTMHVARYFSDGTLTGRRLAEAYRLAVCLYLAVRGLEQ